MENPKLASSAQPSNPEFAMTDSSTHSAIEQPETAPQETVMAVHENAEGYWYIGEGRSIAEGPFRHPGQVLTVASDLLAGTLRWRIEVFDAAGGKIISYSSEQLHARDLQPAYGRERWSALAHGVRH
ncbi:MAG TPA: hypothetical protein VIJ37_08490 [Steroidobacteraceae bacterium]